MEAVGEPLERHGSAGSYFLRDQRFSRVAFGQVGEFGRLEAVPGKRVHAWVLMSNQYDLRMIRQRTIAPNEWIARNLHLGHVSRRVVAGRLAWTSSPGQSDESSRQCSANERLSQPDPTSRDHAEENQRVPRKRKKRFMRD